VRESIDSDVANMATLIRMAGAPPEGLDMGPLLDEARRQLRDEADYAREGAYLDRYGALLADDPDFVVPRRHADFTTEDVLAMDFVAGAPVEAAAEAPQAERDRIAERLIDLALRELLDFRLMQTDPNFANYRWDREAGRIVLLDFGAAREIPAAVAEGYGAMIRASLDGDVAAIREGLIAMGLLDRAAATRRAGELDAMIRLGVETLAAGGPYDFGADPVSRRLRDDGVALASDREFWRAPPADPLFVQRKLAGMHLLANRLRARVDVRALLERRLG
jgi:Predicted unusual protein kinase